MKNKRLLKDVCMIFTYTYKDAALGLLWEFSMKYFTVLLQEKPLRISTIYKKTASLTIWDLEGVDRSSRRRAENLKQHLWSNRHLRDDKDNASFRDCPAHSFRF